jgi:uncharacterized protein (UPF0248 family)
MDNSAPPLTPPLVKPSLQERLKRFILKRRWKELRFICRNKIRNVYSLLLSKYYHFPDPDMIFAGGRFAEENATKNHSSSSCRIVRSHAVDYDAYRAASEESSRVVEGPFAVFMDQYLPFHPEFSLSVFKKSPVEPGPYYSALCRFFSMVEKHTGYKVVIAGHPRAVQDVHERYFEGRSVFAGKSAELVRDSGLVLLHASISTNFAVLFRKKMFFLTSDIIESKIEHLAFVIKAIASYFGLSPINIDHVTDVRQIPFEKIEKIDEKAYSKYKEDYIIDEGADVRHIGYQIADHVKLFLMERNTSGKAGSAERRLQ